jgi:hypothetical protein
MNMFYTQIPPSECLQAMRLLDAIAWRECADILPLVATVLQ